MIRILVFGLALIAAIIGGGRAFADEHDRNLRQFLETRQLDRLSIAMMEIELSQTLDKQRRFEIARQLAGNYRRFLIQNAPSTTLTRVIGKADSLMRDFPDREFPDLGLAVCHARYRQSESRFLDWWSFGAVASRSNSIRKPFDDLHAELQRWSRSFELEYRNAIAAIPFDNLNSNSDSQSQLIRIESRLAHSNFLMGWTCYFQAIVDNELDIQKLNQGHDSFYRALQIEQEQTIDRIDPKWLDFSTRNAKRALLGLAMIYTAKGQDSTANFCFAKLQDRLDDDVRIARFNSLAFSRRWSAAKELANNEIGPRNNDLNSAYLDVVLNAGLVASSNSAGKAAEIEGLLLERMGILGLLRRMDANAIRKFASRSGTKFEDQVFEDLWVQSMIDFDSSLDEPDTQLIDQARRNIGLAIEKMPEELSQVDKARVRFLAALIHFHSGMYQESHNFFPVLPLNLVQVDASLVEKISWLRCRCLIAISRRQPRLIGDTISNMNRHLEYFPTSEFANRIRFEKTLAVNRLLPPREAVQALAKINEDSDYFVRSRFEIVKHEFQHWKSVSNEDIEIESSAFDRLVTVHENFINHVQDPVQRLNSLWLILEASIQRECTESTVSSYLDTANNWIEQAETGDTSLSSRLMNFRFLAARKFNRPESANKHARWLFENSGDLNLEIAALTHLAVNSGPSVSLIEKLEVYENLSQRLGDSQEILSESNNARVAAGRLVELWVRSGEFDRAKELNERLLAISQNNLSYLTNQARIETGLELYDDAASRWRKIARGSLAGSDSWLEAKHESIRLLADHDPVRGQQLLIQTLALAGDLSAAWQERFQQLEKSLGSKQQAKTTTQGGR